MASSPSLSPQSLLAALLPHLNEQTALLPTLHAQLGLPSSALQADLETLRAALLDTVDRAIDSRRREVSEWAGNCEALESSCNKLVKALGPNAKTAGTSVGELRKQHVLPKRVELLSAFEEKLGQIYHTKLEQLNALTNRITTLSNTLGPTFFPSEVLQPTPALGTTAPLDDARRDVTPERFSRLEKELVRGKAEITRRLIHLSHTLEQIVWLYTELGIPLPSLTSSHSLPRFPRSNSLISSSSDPFAMPPSLPDSEDEKESNYLILAKFIVRLEEAEDEDLDGDFLGVEGVDPTLRIMDWFENLRLQCEDEKQRRENHIQVIYDQLEILWRRLGVEEASIDEFVEANRGSTESNVVAYERELDRMLELKREQMSVFIENARAEIKSIWDDLILGDEERSSFSPFTDEEHTEELLLLHETEIKRLKEERRSKAPLLVAIKKYYTICEEQKELEASSTDQSRLLGRGPRDPGRLLREEKMRKRVTKEKPRLEQELLAAIPVWEHEHGYAFLVNGIRMLDMLLDTINAEDAAKDTRKRGRPASTAPIRGTPASRTVGTPSTRSISTSTQPPTKRQRVISTNSRPPISGTNRATPSLTQSTSRTLMKTPSEGYGKTPTSQYGKGDANRTAVPLRTIPNNTTPQPPRGNTSTHKSSNTPSCLPVPSSRIPPSIPRNDQHYPVSKSSLSSSVSSTFSLFGGLGRDNVPAPGVASAQMKRRGVRRESFKPRTSMEGDAWDVDGTGRWKGWIKAERLEEQEEIF